MQPVIMPVSVGEEAIDALSWHCTKLRVVALLIFVVRLKK
jgi:hypothetical protein